MFQSKFLEKIKTRFIFIKFFSKILPFEIMWENIVERDRPKMTIWRTRIARWIPKATNTHSGYVIPNALPLHQLLHTPALNVALYVHCLYCYHSEGGCLLRGRICIYIYIYKYISVGLWNLMQCTV